MATQYKIQSGDTLGQIASKYGTTAQNIAAANGIKDINVIQSGQTINIPDGITPQATPTDNSNPTGIKITPLSFGNTPSSPLSGNGTPSTQYNGNQDFEFKAPNSNTSNSNGYNFSDIQVEPLPLGPQKYTPSGLIGVPGSYSNAQPATQQPSINASTVGNTNAWQIPEVMPTSSYGNNLSVTTNASNGGGPATPTNGSPVGESGTGTTVIKYQANPDGSTTEYLSDGTQQIIPASGGSGLPNVNAGPLNAMEDLIKTAATEGTVSEKAYEDAGIYDKMQQLTTVKNQQLATDRAYQEKIKAIQDANPNGVFGGAAENIALLQRQQLEDDANFAIVTSAANNDLTTAQSIIDQKLQFQFAPIQAEIQNLGTFIDQNRQDLTSSQQVQLENQRFVLQNNLTQLMTAKQQAHQFALTNGISDPAVLSAIDAATTPQQAYDAAQGVIGTQGGNSNQNTQTTGQNIQNVSPQYQNYVDQTSDGTYYVNQDRLNNMTPYQKQIASQQFTDNHIRILQSGEYDALNTIEKARGTLDEFSKAANDLLSNRLAGLTTNQIAQYLQTSPEWRKFQTLREGLISSVQGIAAGAPGLRVTTAELGVAADALPNSADSLASAQQAVKTFGDLLNINSNVLLKPNQYNIDGSLKQNSSNAPSGGSIYDWN